MLDSTRVFGISGTRRRGIKQDAGIGLLSTPCTVINGPSLKSVAGCCVNECTIVLTDSLFGLPAGFS